LGQKQSSDTLGVPKKMNSMTENRDFQSPGLIKKVKVDNAYLE